MIINKKLTYISILILFLSMFSFVYTFETSMDDTTSFMPTEPDTTMLNYEHKQPLGREIVSKRTAKTKTFLNSRTGKMTTMISSGYMHYQDEMGNMQEIDLNIIKNADSTHYQVYKGLYKATFPFQFKDMTYPVTLETSDKNEITTKLQSLAYMDEKTGAIYTIYEAEDVLGKVDGNRIVYSEVFPGISVEYLYIDTELKQNVYVSQEARIKLPTPESYNLNKNHVKLILVSSVDFTENLDAFVEESKVTEKINKKMLQYQGKKKLKFHDENTGLFQFALCEDIAYYELSESSEEKIKDPAYQMDRFFYQENESNMMATGVSYAWFDALPEGTIVLDPSISVNPTDDTWIETNVGYNSVYNNTTLRIGRLNSGNVHRSLLKFNISSLPAGAEIHSANIGLYYYYSTGTVVDRPVQCHRVLQDFTESYTTWFMRASSQNWNVAGVGFDDVDASRIPEDMQVWGTGDVYTWKTYDVSDYAQDCVDASSNYLRVIFWATNESDYTDKNLMYAFSSEYTSDTSKRPYLMITYNADLLAEYTYDKYGRVVQADYDNGITETDYYDQYRGWITERYYKQGATNIFYFKNTSYDKSGNLKQQLFYHQGDQERQADYEYDDLLRLAEYEYESSSVRTYDYDPNGNILNMGDGNWTYTAYTNQMTSDGSTNYSYDDAGRVDQIGASSISYDVQNNMISYGSYDYGYDAFNTRIKSDTKHYVTSGPLVLAEYSQPQYSPRVLLDEYIYGVDGLLVQNDASSGFLWFFKDHLGNTRHLDDASYKCDYYPYGEEHYTSGSSTQMRYTGKELDSNTGLTYFGARYYDRRIARWLAPDPAGQGWSPYVYCNNSPLVLIDPYGEFPWLAAVLSVIGAWYGGSIADGDGWEPNPKDWNWNGQTFLYMGIGAVTGYATGSHLAYNFGDGGGLNLSAWGKPFATIGERTAPTLPYTGAIGSAYAANQLYIDLMSKKHDDNLIDISQIPEMNADLSYLSPGAKMMNAGFQLVEAGGWEYSQPNWDCGSFVCYTGREANLLFPPDCGAAYFHNLSFLEEVTSPRWGDIVQWVGYNYKWSGSFPIYLSEAEAHVGLYAGANSLLHQSSRFGTAFTGSSYIDNLFRDNFAYYVKRYLRYKY